MWWSRVTGHCMAFGGMIFVLVYYTAEISGFGCFVEYCQLPSRPSNYVTMSSTKVRRIVTQPMIHVLIPPKHIVTIGFGGLVPWGTNFGRTAGGPFITPSYDYDAPIDEYGLIRQPKYGHLKELHKVLTKGICIIMVGPKGICIIMV